MNANGPLAVYGPGAVGGLLAALLQRDGQEPVVIARPATAALISTHGITVESQTLGSWTSRFETVQSDPTPLSTILSVKAHALPHVLESWEGAAPLEVLSVLNGVSHAQLLRERLLGTRVVAAAITVAATRTLPTCVEHRSPFIRLSVADDDLDARTVQALASAGVEVVQGGSEHEVLWRKFRFLAPMALLTALHDAPLGPALVQTPELTEALIGEVAVATSYAGLETTPVELRGILETLPPNMRSSLQQDLSAGAPNELEALGGDLLGFGAAHGLSFPTAEEVIDSLRARHGTR